MVADSHFDDEITLKSMLQIYNSYVCNAINNSHPNSIATISQIKFSFKKIITALYDEQEFLVVVGPTIFLILI